jgi:acyl-coenzyme A synthetase/AMP-(fatty) acid ligase
LGGWFCSWSEKGGGLKHTSSNPPTPNQNPQTNPKTKQYRQGYYFTGDGARRDADGCYWITGRVDDVLNVSGHRIGTAEVEGALTSLDACAEAAVIGIPHGMRFFGGVWGGVGADESKGCCLH